MSKHSNSGPNTNSNSHSNMDPNRHSHEGTAPNPDANTQKNKRPNTNKRITRQKQVILEELRNVTCHPTADEVYVLARRRIPNISLGTVYRNLEQLSEQGMIRKLDFAGNQMRFDGRAYNHPHVRCVQCNRIDDVMSVKNNPGRIDVEAEGYRVLGHRLEFYGICPDCQQKERVG